jgi:methylated-DNA-[protein]-cysteine S-methyltransferase
MEDPGNRTVKGGAKEKALKAYRLAWMSPIGKLHFIASDEALLCLGFDQNLQACHKRLAIGELIERENPVIAQAKEELFEYFEGKRRSFSVPIALQGTEFQKRVWEGLRGIPFGATISYREQARDLGHPSAVRATGTANGRNPVAIIVPCHRVVRSDGTLGGYAGGLAIKANLLEMESR